MWEREWEQYCKEWDEECLAAYGIKDRKPPKVDGYLECFLCGNSHKDFVDSGKCPKGSTVQPILSRQETYEVRKERRG